MNPAQELVRAIIEALRANATVRSAIGDRVYESILKPTPFPYISIERVSRLPDDADCIDAMEITVQIDVWTRGDTGRGDVGFGQCYRIQEAVRKALHDEDLTLEDNALVLLRFRFDDAFYAPDRLTVHGPMQFTALVEVPA
jgi:hypothetical protein